MYSCPCLGWSYCPGCNTFAEVAVQLTLSTTIDFPRLTTVLPLELDELELDVSVVDCAPVGVVVAAVFDALEAAMLIRLQATTTTTRKATSAIHKPLCDFFGGGAYGPCGG